MKQNITLSLEKELLQKARILAVKRNSSISKMLGQELIKIVEESEKYESAKKKALSYLKTGFHLGGNHCVSREALHER